MTYRALQQQQRLARLLTQAAWQTESLPFLRCLSTSTGSGGPGDQQGPSRGGTIDFGFRDVPVDDKQELVGQVFRSVAPWYDVMNDLMSGGLHRLWKDRLVEKLRPAPNSRHLDVAGGTGDVAFRVLEAMQAAGRQPGRSTAATAAAAAAGPGPSSSSSISSTTSSSSTSSFAGHVTVCDINPAMLAEGQKKAAQRGLSHASIDGVEGNAEKLPFANDSFDSYTIAFGIRNVTDRMAALRDAHRVLKPGGRFLCLEFSKVVVPGLQQLYDAYSFHVIPQIGRVVAGDADSYQYLVESIRMFPDQERFACMLEEAGFRGVEYENLTAGVVAIHSGFKVT